jgi:hypothetical protein
MSRILLFTLLLLAATLAPATIVAQATVPPVSIDSGMTRAEVIERFGAPSGERSRGEHSYLFYANGRERSVGMSDIVILQSGRVVDAVLRHPARRYTGTSSSPVAISSRDAVRRHSASAGSTTIPPVPY